MRLVVKQNDGSVNRFQFDKGPVYIGRHTKSQIVLPDEGISRQHAVIFNTQDGKWMVEDLDSANKTYLNEQAVHKTEIKTGDILRITNFTIEIDLEDKTVAEEPVDLENTLTTTSHELQIIERKLDSEDAPPIRFPAKRAKDFLQASEKICKVDSLDQLLLSLLDITLEQFGAYHSWCALRNQPTGPMTCHTGKKRDGQAVQLSEIKLNEKINQAVEKNEFLLFIFSRDLSLDKKEQVRSVVIAPIISSAGCFGVLYANNTFREDHYSLSDLDYLMLLGNHTAAILRNL